MIMETVEISVSKRLLLSETWLNMEVYEECNPMKVQMYSMGSFNRNDETILK